MEKKWAFVKWMLMPDIRPESQHAYPYGSSINSIPQMTEWGSEILFQGFSSALCQNLHVIWLSPNTVTWRRYSIVHSFYRWKNQAPGRRQTRELFKSLQVHQLPGHDLKASVLVSPISTSISINVKNSEYWAHCLVGSSRPSCVTSGESFNTSNLKVSICKMEICRICISQSWED